MPLFDCPFTLYQDGIHRPTLQIRIINPHTGVSQRTYGIIDTGADECAVPASYAGLLGHDLKAGNRKIVSTGNGEAVAYIHTTKFEIFNPSTGEVAYTIQDTPIDFLENLHVILLGVHSFLSNFVLRIDYPHKMFSIRYPK
jgi:hypothetical protein